MKILVFGVLFLLAICIYTFEGTMIPAMWQLSSVIWILVWLKFIQE